MELYQHLLNVAKIDRSTLFSNTTKSQPQNPEDDNLDLYLITTYNPANPPLSQIIAKYWPILGRSSGTRLLTKAHITYGHRRPRNLKDTLVKARLSPPAGDIQTNIPKCLRPKSCKHCPRLNKTGKIKSHSTGRTYKTETNISCHSYNFIYCLTCSDCGKQYVGQTENTIIARINSHLSTIRLFEDLHVPTHMQEHGTNLNPNLEVHVLEFIRAPPSSVKAQELRDSVERKWITRLNTLVPQGLNLQD